MVIMAKKETLQQFIKSFPAMSEIIQKKALRSWNQNTIEVQSRSKDKVPIASGQLARSIDNIKAKITKNGIESYVISLQPYAKTIERGYQVRNGVKTPIKLKSAGEFSYYDGGQRWNKAVKGEFKFIAKSVTEMTPEFVQDVMDAIGYGFNKV